MQEACDAIPVLMWFPQYDFSRMYRVCISWKNHPVVSFCTRQMSCSFFTKNDPLRDGNLASPKWSGRVGVHIQLAQVAPGMCTPTLVKLGPLGAKI